ncbi:MAG: L-ribulose-5-phosphate 4-epimerase AraD [Planctomycetota bacterium]|nr:L-ribulose-5-phosphate 4-epimerase AraD [Planctomycetota bacterium]
MKTQAIPAPVTSGPAANQAQRMQTLRLRVLEAHRVLFDSGLTTLTWGNVSQVDREAGLIAIKPSGVRYQDLTPETIVVVDLEGNKVAGELRPSSDTPTHAALYRAFAGVQGIAHNHSSYATMFCQAEAEIPCLGTTHADLFHGPVPVTRQLTPLEVESGYEVNTGLVIVERFRSLDPAAMPGVLVAGHAPFTWGKDAMAAVEAMITLEEVAKLAWGTLSLRPTTPPLAGHIVAKHYSRKHGPKAYYGQC